MKKVFSFFLVLLFLNFFVVFAEEDRIDNLNPLEKYNAVPRKTKPATIGVPKLLEAKERDAKVFFFKSIDFHGCTVLSCKTQARLVKPFLKKKICINDINVLIMALHEAYNNAGYVLENVYFNKESFRTLGHLKIIVVEPKIQGLRLIEGKKRGRRVNNLLDVNNRQVLKLTDFLCASDILNQLETISYGFNLNTNPERTWHVAEFSLKRDKKCVFGLGYDNRGSEDTGRDNYMVEARFEDVLGLFEQWRFMQETTAKPFNKQRYSQTSLISLSVPYRRWRASFWGALEKNAVPYEGIRGYRKTEVVQLGADLRYTLSRTWTSGTYIGGAIEHYSKLFSTADGVLVMPFSGDVTKCILWTSHFHYALGGIVYGKLSYSQGVHASDAGMGHNFNKNFKKLNVDGFFTRGFGNRLTWTLSGKAQIGETHLFSHEKFSLGGMSTVRGFVDTQYKSDSGYFLRNELEYLLFNRYATKFFVGYDYGHLNPSKRDVSLHEKSLQSICCGVRLNIKDIHFEMLMARPVRTVTSNRYTFLFGIKGEF